MDLFELFELIIFEEKIDLTTFLEKSKISKTVYYAVKKGNKTKLKPEQAQNINSAFPNYSYDLLMGNVGLVSEPSATCGTVMDLANKGRLGVVLNKNHKMLLEQDESYALWYDKMVNIEAMKLLKETLSNK